MVSFAVIPPWVFALAGDRDVLLKWIRFCNARADVGLVSPIFFSPFSFSADVSPVFVIFRLFFFVMKVLFSVFHLL